MTQAAMPPAGDVGSAGTGAPEQVPGREPAGKPVQPASPNLSLPINPATRESLIRRAAYILYERRGRVDGHADEDWLRAEALIDRVLMAQLTRELFTPRPDASRPDVSRADAARQMPPPGRSQ